MRVNSEILKEILKVIPRIALFVAGMCLFAIIKESLVKNYYQHDDAWIADAIMLFGISLAIAGLFIGNPKKYCKNPRHIVEDDEDVL